MCDVRLGARARDLDVAGVGLPRSTRAQCGADAPAYNATGVQRVIAGDPGPLEMGASWDRTRVDSLQGATTHHDRQSATQACGCGPGEIVDSKRDERHVQ
jgi:hypothetical protein